ncbi:thiol-disulfide oxidoreductase DCC family protein [Halomonas sp. HMF6819]|uniref:thiol-disulfide oxidoreductase DCC family protein n=1 Tax=Halomonas sp. HMF6819 TaxID=3373085 RepID=UPI003795196D
MNSQRFKSLNARAPVTLYYDGHCPFCLKEVAWLEKHPRRQRIELVDIQASTFDAATVGCNFDDLMGKLHVKDRNEQCYIGMEASRALYAVLGYRRMVGMSCLPGLRGVMDAGYRLFARYRVRLGRWVEKRQTRHSR